MKTEIVWWSLLIQREPESSKPNTIAWLEREKTLMQEEKLKLEREKRWLKDREKFEREKRQMQMEMARLKQ